MKKEGHRYVNKSDKVALISISYPFQVLIQAIRIWLEIVLSDFDLFAH